MSKVKLINRLRYAGSATGGLIQGLSSKTPQGVIAGAGVGGVNYNTGVIEGAVANNCGGLMPNLSLGFGEGIKAFFG